MPLQDEVALYQGLTGEDEDANSLFKQFSPGFFDLIVVDECHRGSAKADSQWREVLEYFSSATQIGLTATPKETNTVSNIDYFGEPIYTYSLKQGIDDGYLAPYRVIRVFFDKDIEGFVPYEGQLDDNGEVIDNRLYNTTDFDKNLVLERRTKLVAKTVSDYLTRVREDLGKLYFTIFDFRDVTRLFHDEDFDGPIEQQDDFESHKPGPGPETPPIVPKPEHEKRKKYVLGDMSVAVSQKHVQYLDKNGNLITESFIGECEPMPAPNVPGLVRRVITDKYISCESGIDKISIYPQEIASGQWMGFWERLQNEERNIPYIYISHG